MIRKEKRKKNPVSSWEGGIEVSEAPSLQCFALLVEKGININTKLRRKTKSALNALDPCPKIWIREKKTAPDGEPHVLLPKTKKDKEKRHAVVAPDRVRAAGEGMSSPD